MIEGVVVKKIEKFEDQRGWLSELFRHDMMEEELYPPMAYISYTHPGVARGPHEHVEQWDHFVFLGPSTFKLVLWDNREKSPTYGEKMELLVGEENPSAVFIPPGVVHGYKNVGETMGMVLNFPNKLYRGWGKKDPVDEIRHEDDPNSPFKLD
jgi:dTDP-4-dehydrorhamnose 3,5-epimerase